MALPGSPAIDAGNPAYSGPFTTDQRGPGFPRVKGNRIDIGAIEVGSDLPTATATTEPSQTPSTSTTTATAQPSQTPITPTATATTEPSQTPTMTTATATTGPSQTPTQLPPSACVSGCVLLPIVRRLE